MDRVFMDRCGHPKARSLRGEAVRSFAATVDGRLRGRDERGAFAGTTFWDAGARASKTVPSINHNDR